jgi:hypothetical protein
LRNKYRSNFCKKAISNISCLGPFKYPKSIVPAVPYRLIVASLYIFNLQTTAEDWETTVAALELMDAIVNFTAVSLSLWPNDPTPVVLSKQMVNVNDRALFGEDEKTRIRYQEINFFYECRKYQDGSYNHCWNRN